MCFEYGSAIAYFSKTSQGFQRINKSASECWKLNIKNFINPFCF